MKKKLKNSKIVLIAPHTGARIEIVGILRVLASCWIAPHTGARIEMLLRLLFMKTLSPIAPHTGARIEIDYVYSEFEKVKGSHPTWVRGLKYGR